MKEFDPQTLAEFDGRDSGKPVYVARDSKVYDVSGSKLWQDGQHMKRHQAGRDLSADFEAAPHGVEVFERVSQVGVLAEKDTAADRRLPPWLARILRRYPILGRHPHPMLVHYPIVFMFAVPGFTLLALISGVKSFETTAFHCLGAGVLFLPLTISTGLFTWWLNYQARPMRPVRIKIWFSVLLLLDALIAFIWRWATPNILTAPPAGFVYLLLICSLAALVSIIGWFGAQLTFPMENRNVGDRKKKTE